MSQALPRRPHLESLRKQARQLVRAHRAGDPGACERIRRYIHKLRQVPDPVLCREPFPFQSAQCVVAREYGFPNWGELTKAVDIIRQAESAMLAEVDDARHRGQPLHILVRKHVVQEVWERVAQHCAPTPVLLSEWPKSLTDEAFLEALEGAAVVVASPDTLGFPVMYERLRVDEEPQLAHLLGRTRAFLNMPRSDERTPLIISGPDPDSDGDRDLISMYCTELYGLYAAVSDHRY